MSRLIWGVLCLLAASSCASKASDDGAQVAFTISGEDSALDGFAFPPTSEDVVFVDGWEVKLERLLVTVGDIVLTTNPDSSVTDQSITGPVVARAHGPWAVDLAKVGAPLDPPLADANGTGTPGSSGLSIPVTGRGSASDRAVRLVRFDRANVSGEPFDVTARYGVGYDLLAATASADKLNLDATAGADYALMVTKGWSVLYVGTATFHGGATCQASSMASYATLPTTVHFRLGFATPAQYINCQNSDLTGKAFEGEEKQRGIQLKANALTYEQLTLHLEHPFFDTTAHDQAKPFFDQIAVVARNGEVTLDDIAAQDPSHFLLTPGVAMPWRSCLTDLPPNSGDRHFDAGSLSLNPGASPAIALRNYADYMQYQESTMGHLNADGLCAVNRKYPSPL